MRATLLRDRSGAVMTEFAIVGPLIILFVLSIIELSTALWQWNAAAKAAQYGARLAATSESVASGLDAFVAPGNPCVPGTNCPGDAVPYFLVTCSGASGACTGGGGALDANALQWIVRGPDNVCAANTGGRPGMCDIYGRITPANVTVTYEQTGIGFIGNPSGPTPSVTVRIQGLQFATPLLGLASGLFNVTLPPFATTVIAEDMRSTAP